MDSEGAGVKTKKKYWMLSKWPMSEMRLDPEPLMMTDYDGVPAMWAKREDAREFARDAMEIEGARWYVVCVSVTTELA